MLGEARGHNSGLRERYALAQVSNIVNLPDTIRRAFLAEYTCETVAGFLRELLKIYSRRSGDGRKRTKQTSSRWGAV